MAEIQVPVNVQTHSRSPTFRSQIKYSSGVLLPPKLPFPMISRITE